LQMKLADAKTFISVVSAVCNNLSNELLLGADITDKLNHTCCIDQLQVSLNDCDVNLLLQGDDCVDLTPKIMTGDVGDTTLSVNNDADDETNSVADLNDVNNDNVSAVSKNVAGAE